MILRKLPTFFILVLILTLWTDSAVQSQNIYPRLSLIEQFTSATSAPCVDAIPVMARVAQLRNNAVSIRYHLDFPDPGDPWNISNPVESEARRAFYDVTAIPSARVNGGAEVDPRDEQELQTQLSTDRREMSPVYITVVQDGGTIKVRVWSSIALNAHRLHVAIVSQLTRIPELSGLPGSNGQTSFSDSMLDLLTESNGLSITIPANGNQEFEFPIELGNGQLWPDNQQYAIAFVQANSNQEVIQAGTMRNSTDTTQIAFIR
ncbi:MAG: hypothetical protein MUC47_04090, partial [Candidatus Kapabacteria bacterium]|nr:hypothetical protein [Candidatus Kapabacteria bacterium]